MSVTVGKLYRHWSHVGGEAAVDAYVRKALLRTWLDEKRRPWHRREQVTGELPEPASPAEFAVVNWAQPLDLLDGLPPRRRAAVVLRLYLDLSVEETAEILSCSVGTVESQTARIRHAADDLGTHPAAVLPDRAGVGGRGGDPRSRR